jgi:hypothetical protein
MSYRRGAAIAFGLYAIAAVTLLYRHGILAGTNYLGNGADPSLYMWMFAFFPRQSRIFRIRLCCRQLGRPLG